MRLRHLIHLNPSPAAVRHLPGDTPVVFVPMEAIEDGLGGMDTSISRPLSEALSGSYSYFAEGDILLAKVTPCFENGKKAIAENLPHEIGFATSEVHVVRVDNDIIDRRYLLYLFASERFRSTGIGSMLGAGGLRRVPEETVVNFRLPITEPSMQRRIADFLDRETAKIDDLITKKARLGELLEEKRRAYVSTIFDRLASEGIPQVRLRHLISEPIKYGANEAGDDDDPRGVRFIRITDLTEDGRLRSDSFRSLPWDKAQPFLLQDGDLLFARSGATVGKAYMYREEHGPACFAGYLVRVRPNKSLLLPQFLMLYTNTQSYWDFIDGASIQATIQNVSAEKYLSLTLPVPTLSEQEAVIQKADSLGSALSQAGSTIKESISRLRELRSALITAAVTGQIDVEEWSRRGETERRIEVVEAEAAGA